MAWRPPSTRNLLRLLRCDLLRCALLRCAVLRCAVLRLRCRLPMDTGIGVARAPAEDGAGGGIRAGTLSPARSGYGRYGIPRDTGRNQGRKRESNVAYSHSVLWYASVLWYTIFSASD